MIDTRTPRARGEEGWTEVEIGRDRQRQKQTELKAEDQGQI